MKVIIAGSRTIGSMFLLNNLMEFVRTKYNIYPSLVFSGRANGVDKLGEEWSDIRNIPISYYNADWKHRDKVAGDADVLCYIWDGKSNGTKNMIDEALIHDCKVFGIVYTGDLLFDYKAYYLSDNHVQIRKKDGC